MSRSVGHYEKYKIYIEWAAGSIIVKHYLPKHMMRWDSYVAEV